MSHHLISSAPLFKWPDPSWIHWHLIIKHIFSMVCTFSGTSISFLNDFETFLEEFGVFFGNSYKECTSTNKLQALHQRSRPAFVYVSKFRWLTHDISWDEVVFMNQFQFRLHGDVKDLLLTMPEPMTLSQAIVQIVRYDNQLFEHWPNTFHYLTSWTLVSRWSNLSWTHSHLIIMHNFNMVYTSFGMLISFSKWLWNIS